LNNSIRTADELSTKLPVTDLNVAPKRGTDSNLHRYNYVGAVTGAGAGDECDHGCGLDDAVVKTRGVTTDITIVSDVYNSENIGDGANTASAVCVEKINKQDGNYHLRDCSLDL